MGQNKKGLKRFIIGLIMVLLVTQTAAVEPVFASSGRIVITNLASGNVIEPGRQYRIKYRVKGKYRGKKVKFKSSNPSVVSVTKKGVLKAHRKGAATITVYVKRHKRVKKTIRIKVGVRVDAMSLGSTVHLRKGHKKKLKAKILPANAANKGLAWKSSDKKVVKVSSSGTVTALKTGTARITARAKDGSGVKASVSVVVYKAPKKGNHRWLAHRGEHYEDGPIENTAAAFTKAGKSGFWGAECDIWETLPQIVIDEEGNETETSDFVINHDETFLRIWGVDRPVKSMTAEEIRSASYLKGVCFLDQFLGICAKYGMVPVIELKDEDLTERGVRRVVDLVYETGVRLSGSEDGGLQYLQKANLISLHPKVVVKCREYAEQQYGVSPVTCFVIGCAAYKGDLSEIKRAKERGFTAVTMKKELITDQYSRYCLENGIELRAFSYGKGVASDEAVYQQIIKGQHSIQVFSTNGKIFR